MLKIPVGYENELQDFLKTVQHFTKFRSINLTQNTLWTNYETKIPFLGGWRLCLDPQRSLLYNTVLTN